MITVITPTIGSPHLVANFKSVQAQTVPVKQIIVVDGNEYTEKVFNLIASIPCKNVSIVQLPENTGRKKYYGHRIYAGMPYMINTDYVSFLDEDCTLHPNFAEIMMGAIGDKKEVATCRRSIIDQHGVELGADNVESIGLNEFGYTLHDINTYLFRTIHWHRYSEALDRMGWGADRLLAKQVERLNRHTHIKNPLVNYRIRGDRQDFYKSIIT